MLSKSNICEILYVFRRVSDTGVLKELVLSLFDSSLLIPKSYLCPRLQNLQSC